MPRTKVIGWTAFGFCLLGYGGFAAIMIAYKLGHLEWRETLLYGGPVAVVGEIGLWVAAGCLGWTIFKRRKAVFDRIFRRGARAV